MKKLSVKMVYRAIDALCDVADRNKTGKGQQEISQCLEELRRIENEVEEGLHK